MSSYRMKYKIGLVEHSVVVPEDISAIPLGTILPYSANTMNPPAGFLFCDGSAISISMYPDLFGLIGTLYGSGDGSTTFNLPNLIGKFPEGNSTAGTSKEAGLPNIKGAINIRKSTNGVEYSTFFKGVSAQGANAISQTGNDTTYQGNNTMLKLDSTATQTPQLLTFNASDYNPIYSDSAITVQPSSLTVRYIIKAFVTVSNESALVDVTHYASDLATRLQRHQVPAFNRLVKIHASQTYTAPVRGWYKFTIKGAGGGGGGGSTASDHACCGASGGEGGTTFAYEFMEKDDTAVITVGAGGSGGAHASTIGGSSSDGTKGGDSSVVVNGKIYTAGGGGGSANAGGVGGTGDIRGSAGLPALRHTNSSARGVQAAGYGGGGATYANSGAGGKGGNASVNSLSYVGNGAAGSAGYVWIEYFDPAL